VPYEYAEWSKARVNIDYHIQVAGHFYSVPHQLARHEVEVRCTATTVEIFHKARRVAVHRRGKRKGAFTTDPAHMPAAHRAHLEWSPSRLIRWAGTVGPQAKAFTQRLLESRPHPEQGYRSCLGLMRLARAYPAERVEAACRRALAIGALSYSSVNSILKTGLDSEHVEGELQLRLPGTHEHVRGPDYYRNLQGD
jgi:transposase